MPGAFPETPAAEQPSFGINPFPASAGIGNPVSIGAGQPLPPSTKSVTDNVTLDKASYDNAGSSTASQFPKAVTPAAEEPSFSVNPIPASTGIGNPVSIGAGQPLPPSTKSVTDNVTLDKASYDNAGSSTAPQLPEVVTPAKERAAKGGMFGIDNTPGAGTMIPESGLAMGASAGFGAAALAAMTNPHISSVGSNSTTAQLAGQVPLEPRGNANISSVGPTSTTADLAGQVPLEPRDNPNISSVGSTSTTANLAGQVPLEPRGDYNMSSVGADATTAGLAGQVPLETGGVPETVEKSQELANASPEASANPEAVGEKSAVENELLSKVPEAPAASDNSISGKAAGIAAGIVGTATAAATGAAAYLSSGQVTKDVKSQLPVAAQEKLDGLSKSNGSAGTSSGIPIASNVPDTVQESISKAHQSPEAAAVPEAVQEKSAVESELLQKTHAATSSNAIAAAVPETVQESFGQSHQSPEAAVNAEAVKEKSAVESELLKKVEPATSAGEPAPTISAATATTAPQATKSTPTASEGLAAPASSQAQSSAAATSGTLAAPASSQAEGSPSRDSSRRLIDSRDVSPMTRGPGDTSAPLVTTGVASATTEAKSTPATGVNSTPTKATTSTAAASSSTPTSSANTTPHESPAGDKKKNRRSGFFGRLKEKLEHRKDKH